MEKVWVLASMASSEGSFRPLTRMASTSSFAEAGGTKLLRVALSINRICCRCMNSTASRSLLSNAAMRAGSASRELSTSPVNTLLL